MWILLFALIFSCCGTQGQVIRRPSNVTTYKGGKAEFTCVLDLTNRDERYTDLEWYRFTKGASTAELLDPYEDRINFYIHTAGNRISSSLNINNAVTSYTGHYWIGTPSFSVCNTSLAVVTIISEPDDVTVCEGTPAVFTCELDITDSSLDSDDIQWYRFINETHTTEMINQQDITSITNNRLTSSLTVANVRKSHTGYYWVETQHFSVCNASLTVLISPSALTVTMTKSTESSSVVVQWDEVDDSLPTTYTVTWTSERDLNNVQVKNVEEQSSCTITGLTLDTVYTITVTAINKCGGGPEYSTTILLSTDTTTSISSITATTSTHPIVSTSTANPVSISTTTVTISETTTTTIFMMSLCTTTTDSVSNTVSRNTGTTTNTAMINTNLATTVDPAITTLGATSTITTTTVIEGSSIITTTTAVANNICDRAPNVDESDSSGISTGAVAVITFTVTFIVSVTATAIITFIVAYACVKRTLEKVNNTHNPNDPMPQEKVIYEDVCLPSKPVIKKDVVLQRNPSYGTSREVVRATNPAYENM